MNVWVSQKRKSKTRVISIRIIKRLLLHITVKRMKGFQVGSKINLPRRLIFDHSLHLRGGK